MDRQEIKFLLNYIENNPEHLSPMQHEFFASLKQNYKSTGVLTKRQAECLNEIKEDIPSLVTEDAVYESQSDKYPAQYSSFNSLTTFNM